jgi:hypothetical protein
MKEAKTDLELEVIRADIALAHRWADNYFHPELVPDRRIVNDEGQFIPLHGTVEYPQPDMLVFVPYTLGEPMPFEITYRLHFKPDGGLVWESHVGNQIRAYLVVRRSDITDQEVLIMTSYIKLLKERMGRVTPEQAYNLGSVVRAMNRRN